MPRRPLDQYETPPHYVEPLLQRIGPLDGLTVYEPCVGQGHIAKYLTDARWLGTNDLDPSCPATMHEDARTERAWPDPALAGDEVYDWSPDWTITNPPFAHELTILRHALAWSKNVAFLARLSFLEPTQSRADFWHCHPPTDVIVLPRYSFRLNDQGKRQTDNVTCIWILWRAGQPACLEFSRWRAS